MMVNKKSFLSLIPVALSIAMLTLAWSEQNFSAGRDNTPLPKFSLPLLSNPNKHLTNKALLGHVSLVNFWASWCGYCRMEHKELLRIKNTNHVPIYGIDYKDSAEDGQGWLDRAGNPYAAVVMDEEGEFGNAVGLYGTPETLIIDKKGNIRYRYSGELDHSAWVNELKPLVDKYEKEG